MSWRPPRRPVWSTSRSRASPRPTPPRSSLSRWRSANIWAKMATQATSQATPAQPATEAAEPAIKPAAYAVGLAHYGAGDQVLDTWYPVPNCNENFRTAQALAEVTGYTGGTASFRLNGNQIEYVLEKL